MGIVVKVYIDDKDQEIDIVTLNSDDHKSSSVTITASFIKDYLNKLGNGDGASSCRDRRVITHNQDHESHNKNISDPGISLIENNSTDNNSRLHHAPTLDDSVLKKPICSQSDADCNASQSRNVKCTFSALHENVNTTGLLTPDNVVQLDVRRIESVNSVDNETISQSSILSIHSDAGRKSQCANDVQNFVQAIEDTEVPRYTDSAEPADVIVVKKDRNLANIEPAEQDLLVVADNCSVTDNLEGGDSRSTNVYASSSEPSTSTNERNCVDSNDRVILIVPSENTITSSSRITNVSGNNLENLVAVSSEIDVENVMESLKNVSYDVDDFLTMVNNTPSCQSNLQSYYSSFPFFVEDLNTPPASLGNERNDSEDLEECFVIENIAASRLNPETKLSEYLLKPQICTPKKEKWSPIADLNTIDLSMINLKSLYIQCPQGFKAYKRRILNERLAEYIQMMTLERRYPFDVNSEVSSSCRPVSDTSASCDFSSYAADVIIDPQKSLNDACLSETGEEREKNIPQIKHFSDEESDDITTETGLPSAHFVISDMILGEEVVDFLDCKEEPFVTVSTIITNEAKATRKKLASVSSKSGKAEVNGRRRSSKYLNCSDCGYKTISMTTLENHIRRHSKEALRCKWCVKRFYSISGLRRHEKKHTDEDSRRGGNGNDNSYECIVNSSPLSSFPESSIPVEQRNLLLSVDLERTKLELNSASLTSEENSQLLTEWKTAESSEVLTAVASIAKTPTAPSSQPLNGVCNSPSVFSAVNLINGSEKCRKKKVKRLEKEQFSLTVHRGRGRPRKKKLLDENDNPSVVVFVTSAADAGNLTTCSMNDNQTNNVKTPNKGFNDLQRCLAETANSIDDKDFDYSRVEPSQKKGKDTRCLLCQLSFETLDDFLSHREKMHKFPIVLIKRLPM